MIYLPRSAGRLASLAAGDSARYALTCVRVRELPGGQFRVEATDGKALGVLRGPSLPSKADRRAAQALPRPESLALEALLPAASLRKAFKALPKGDRGGGRRLGVLLANPQSLLVVGDGVLPQPTADARFPDFGSVLPARPALVSFRVNPDLLVDLLKVAAAAMEEGGGVEILYWGAGKPIGLISQGADGVAFDGLLMPLAEASRPAR
jgi:hypothetical protein